MRFGEKENKPPNGSSTPKFVILSKRSLRSEEFGRAARSIAAKCRSEVSQPVLRKRSAPEVFGDTLIARPARFPIELSHPQRSVPPRRKPLFVLP
jgi:hypothetical protein